MADVKIDISQWPAHMKKLGARMHTAVQRGVVSGAYRCIPLLQKRAEQAPPASAGGAVGAFNTGRYRGAFKLRTLANGAAVFNDAPYASVIDGGRRANSRMPPLEVIARWAQRRIGLSVKDARAAAWPMARAIARRGLRPRRVMSGGKAEMKRLIEVEIERELETELGR